jgi:hypothetical protein
MGSRAEKIKAFLSEVVGVCEKHQLSISHEDSQGGFIIVPYNKPCVDWLLAASDEESLEDPSEYEVEEDKEKKDGFLPW